MEAESEENISIWVKRQPESKERLLRCIICTSAIVRVKGEVYRIVPGDPDAEGEPITRFPSIQKCTGSSPRWGKCPAKYFIEGIVENV